MQLVERQKAFLNAAKSHFKATTKTKINQAFGVSNSAKVIEAGIQLGVPNLNGYNGGGDAFLLLCLIRFPPEDEVYFAIQCHTDIALFDARLAEMKRLGVEAKLAKSKKSTSTDDAADVEHDDDAAPSDDFASPESNLIEYRDSNNLVATYLASDGKLYFRNKKFWDSLNFDLSTIGPGVRVDGIAFAIYPPAASARRSTLAQEFVGYLGKFVGRQKVHELKVWPDAMAVSATMRRMPASIPVADIRRDIEALGGHYVDGLIERFHEGLNFLTHKHFVILSGLSGTGKTQLALQYARVVHGLTSMDEPDPLLRICPVRPEWTDPSGLTGYHDMLAKRFEVPRFLEAVLLATAHRESPVFVVLDEMNLARVEHYFADILSAMETRGGIQLHSSGVPIESSTGGEVRAEVPFPSNLFIVATINVDESTNPVSDKVLDRAVVIDMTQVDLPGFMTKLATRFPDLATSKSEVGELLTRLNAELLPNACGFGYRVAEEIVRYHAFASVLHGRNSAEVIDDMLAQKVLVKLRGSHAQRQMLANLGKLLGAYPRSGAIAKRMSDELDELGSFRYGR